jgi:hypothetical protein
MVGVGSVALAKSRLLALLEVVFLNGDYGVTFASAKEVCNYWGGQYRGSTYQQE